MEIIASEWSYPDTGMLCGSYEAEIRCFKKLLDARGRVWLVANQEDAASNVYVHDPRDTKSEGFAGRTLTFKLEDGTEYAAKGPWHTSAEALFEATGHDVRNTYYTVGAVGLKSSNKHCGQSISDVIYLEKEPILGPYKRVDAIAQRIADELDTVVFCLMRSRGGGSRHPVRPSNWTDERYQAFWLDKRA